MFMRLVNFLQEQAVRNFYYDDEDPKISGTAKKAVILTKGLEVTKTPKKIMEWCEKHNIECKLAKANECYLTIKDDKIFISNAADENPLKISPKTTLIINRVTSEDQKSAPLDVITQFEKNKFFCVNTRDCIETCSDKFRTTMRLVEQGLNTPRSCMIRSVNDIEHAHKQVGNKWPVIVKTIYGSKGHGVFIAESDKNLKSALQTIWSANPNVEMLMQEFVKNGGWDYRIHVLADKVIACMKRISGNSKKEFRNNYSLGGSVENVKIKDLPDEVIDLAVKSAKAVKATWCGVDIIQNQDTKEYTVLEVNSSPGTDGIEKATKIPVTGIVMEYITKKENWVPATTTCGYIENIWIEDSKGPIGYYKAKFDTGNGVLCAIHADSVKIKDKKVEWKLHGKTYTSDLITTKKVIRGGLNKDGDRFVEERPVIKLTIKFNGDTYKNILFTIMNRLEKMGTEILINRSFMKLAALNVDPSAKYLLSLEKPIDTESKKKMA